MSDSDEKTFDPTEQRREQYRKDGRYARARDAGAIAATVAGIGVLLGSRGAIGTAMQALFAHTLGDLEALSHGRVEPATHAAVG
ncbi:MAG: EscU/YscU/HrcU family type III secretion system export apparatus switch protein, partial [Deltaproteobacteria bacterium]